MSKPYALWIKEEVLAAIDRGLVDLMDHNPSRHPVEVDDYVNYAVQRNRVAKFLGLPIIPVSEQRIEAAKKWIERNRI